jgi:hypothetical protein
MYQISQIVVLSLVCLWCHLWVTSPTVSSGQPCKTVITFDEIDAEHDIVVADNYLKNCGITVNDVTPGTRVYIINDQNLYQGRTVKASSGHNVLTQGNSPEPVSFTLKLPQPMQTVQFTRPKLIAGLNGITFPEWNAEALDGNGRIVGKPVGEPLGQGPEYFKDIPAKTFTLTGPGIQAVRFNSKNHHFAAFSAVIIDDLTLEPEGSH